MKLLSPALLCLLSTIASGTIKPIAYHQQVAAGVTAEYKYQVDHGGGVTEWVYANAPSFNLNHNVSALPPQAQVFQQSAPLPNQPAAAWTSTAPAINYQFSIPQWEAPAAPNGEFHSIVSRFDISCSVTGTPTNPSPPFLSLSFEFETTEAMLFSCSGWIYVDQTSGFPTSAPIDALGRLLPGRHKISNWVSGLGTYTLSLKEAPFDSDGDGLGDLDELNIHHTDPTKADTDTDGFTDGFEVESGTSPLAPLSFPAERITIHQAVELRIVTKLGVSYRIQSSTDLQDWQDTPLTLEGTGREITRIFQAIEGQAKYWRVREEQ